MKLLICNTLFRQPVKIVAIVCCFLSLGGALVHAADRQASLHTFQEIWTKKPILSNILYNTSRIETLAQVMGLDDEAKENLADLVLAEKEEIFRLYTQSEQIVRDSSFTLMAKTKKIQESGYNEEVITLAYETLAKLREIIPADNFLSFISACYDLWQKDLARIAPLVKRNHQGVTSTTYIIFATQYNGETDFEVAIPDKYIKFSNRKWQIEPGYAEGNFTVSLALDGREASILVWDVGPWNIDDNYWNPADHPDRPRRLFADLPVGTPEAQAAFQENYNGGLDQFGRTVLNHAGVDLSPAVAAKLGLGYLENAFIEVTFLWEQKDDTQPTGGSIPPALFLLLL